jgi:transformation/transcription domain-associated protein
MVQIFMLNNTCAMFYLIMMPTCFVCFLVVVTHCGKSNCGSVLILLYCWMHSYNCGKSNCGGSYDCFSFSLSLSLSLSLVGCVTVMSIQIYILQVSFLLSYIFILNLYSKDCVSLFYFKIYWHCDVNDALMQADLGVKTKTQLLAEKSVFKILLTTIIAADAEPDLHDPKDDFVSNVCRHFAMVFHIDSSTNASIATAALGGSVLSSNVSVSSRSKTGTCLNLKELDPLIFLDALVDVLADENRLHAKAALNALDVFSETLLFLARSKHADLLMSGGPGTPMIVSSPSMNPVYSPPPSVRIPVFEQLLPRLLHCCYGSTWQAQMGGVMGLGALVGKVTVEILCLFQVRIVRGLVHVLKRLPIYASKEQEETSQVLTQVLPVLNNVDEANSEPHKQSFQGVVEFLASELFNPNASVIVRKNVQSCLSLLANRTGSEVSELLEPLYQPLLQPLIMRPLRSRTLEQQVNFVSNGHFVEK